MPRHMLTPEACAEILCGAIGNAKTLSSINTELSHLLIEIRDPKFEGAMKETWDKDVQDLLEIWISATDEKIGQLLPTP